ncbi:MAG: FxsB family cyclophane-forming radical SAM/SPASM peptide maturase [Trebonia sp.]
MGREQGMEWPFTLNVSALLADGWRPVPFEEFIVKINSRCDLSCDYCYMYEMADQSWRGQPKRMPVEIAEATARRIGQHARDHGLRKLALILHGGEPLLAGPELIWHLVEATRKAVGPQVAVAAHVQTNAVGLNDVFLRLFDELDVRVGVSLDGGPDEHNRHRRFASGRGSYAAVAAGIERLRQPWFRHLFGGLLCTVDVRNDPIATYEALLAFAPPAIDFLLPHGTWDAPPPGRGRESPQTPYADWLIAVFDRWYRDPRVGIRMFESIIGLLVTGASSGETVGLAPSTMVVIETDGSIEQVDSLKAAYEGAAATGLHVIRDELDAALYRPGMVARQIGVRALAAECRRCPIRQVCGGGQYPHRYRSGSGFANPSVYCPDLMRLIEHVAMVVQADVASRLDKAWLAADEPDEQARACAVRG